MIFFLFCTLFCVLYICCFLCADISLNADFFEPQPTRKTTSTRNRALNLKTLTLYFTQFCCRKKNTHLLILNYSYCSIDCMYHHVDGCKSLPMIYISFIIEFNSIQYKSPMMMLNHPYVIWVNRMWAIPASEHATEQVCL